MRQRGQITRRGAFTAFTLVELLVVMGIIAVLIAILMPSLTRARDAAKQVMCSSNLHQLYIAIVMYGNDNKAWLPGPYPDARGSEMRGVWWSGGTGVWDYHTPSGQTIFVYQKLDRYVPAHSKVWLCPGWPEDERYVATPAPPNPAPDVVGTPYNPTAGAMPCTPANIGMGYTYKPVARQWAAWPGVETYEIRFGKQKFPWAADVLCCMPGQNWQNEYGPHARGKLWQNLFVDGSIRATGGLYQSNPDWSIVVNLPPDAIGYPNSADWEHR